MDAITADTFYGLFLYNDWVEGTQQLNSYHHRRCCFVRHKMKFKLDKLIRSLAR